MQSIGSGESVLTKGKDRDSQTEDTAGEEYEDEWGDE